MPVEGGGAITPARRGCRSDSRAEWREVRAPVEHVDAFGPLQRAHDDIGQRRQHDLPRHLQRPLREQYGDDQLGREAFRAQEGDGIEDQAVHAFAQDGRADRAGPQMLAAGPHLHACHDIAVDELARPEGENARQYDPRHLAEDDGIGRLVAPGRRRGQGDDHPAHERHEHDRRGARPDHATRAGIAVDFGQHVADHVADRKEQDAGAERPWPDAGQRHLRDLARADDVRQQQDRDERRHHEIIIAKRLPRQRARIDRPFVPHLRTGKAGFPPAVASANPPQNACAMISHIIACFDLGGRRIDETNCCDGDWCCPVDAAGQRTGANGGRSDDQCGRHRRDGDADQKIAPRRTGGDHRDRQR
ncbi:hypothetical protein WR25_02516 [Diploscapter pachys]|uniref:Uncharacterized protein n=1 Tax=Diploscapter pachys TaxID=2018661 RepID=A0A2A2K126_9BILA|nr:hypothetical protein WR25_02516 [Diploscapter pachys]